MDDCEVSDDGALVIAAVDALSFGIVDDIVANDGIGGGLDAVVAGVPNDVSLDDIGGLAVGVVDDDAGVVGVVDHVVADDVSVASIFELDSVALGDGATFQIMDVVVCDDGVENVAIGRAIGLAVGAEVEGFAVAAGMMNVVVAEGQGFVNLARVICGHRNGPNVVDVEVFEGDEFCKMPAFFPDPNG